MNNAIVYTFKILTFLLSAAALAAGGDADSISADIGKVVDPVVSTKSTGAINTSSGAAYVKAYVVPVVGTVDHGMAAFVGRCLRAASKEKGVVVVLDIDTYGGQVDAAFNIVDSITACPVPTVAFVRSKAISAGALIALSADKMAMRPGATIGDVAPLINTSEGPKMLGEKHQSPIRAKFRAMAERNGYPAVLTEAMVTEEIAVFEVTLTDTMFYTDSAAAERVILRPIITDTVFYVDSAKLAALDPWMKSKIASSRKVVRAGELLTMTDAEALRYGFSAMTAGSVDEMLQRMGYKNAAVVSASKNWSEGFVSVIAMLAPVLMMIGFSCIYIEMRSPGFGIPGIIGICCLAIVFFGQYAVGLANYTELILLALGAALLALEVLVIPGFGFAGIAGIALLIIGMVLSFQSFVVPNPEFPWQAAVLKRNIVRVSVSIIGSIVLIIVFFKYFFKRLGTVVKGPYLAATLEGAQSDLGMSFVPKIGDRGVASTPLRPSGKVRIGADLCDVVTEGQFVDSGAEVVISQVQGNRIVVAPVTA
ncbi:MAG: ATP-dependent Clp protease proteolytic subunit [Chitinispirillales bacterium]|jgi:membrane-bound serine protease (ClpP class)|nr:ATP-dependent Clp protease proteolytic subunit [Chitinispirillales bacterium]